MAQRTFNLTDDNDYAHAGAAMRAGKVLYRRGQYADLLYIERGWYVRLSRRGKLILRIVGRTMEAALDDRFMGKRKGVWSELIHADCPACKSRLHHTGGVTRKVKRDR